MAKTEKTAKPAKRVETLKNEIRFFTSDLKQMAHKYLAQNLLRSWKEDFIDEDSGEVVSIERNEVIAQRGRYIDQDLLTEINFFLQSKAIESVEVSNQKREASIVMHTGLVPWSVSAQIGKKKHRFLLYAANIYMALDIAKDFIELNFTDRFYIIQAKEFTSCIFIKSNLKKGESATEETSDLEKKFYQIDAKITHGEEEISEYHTFIVHTIDVDTAMIFINDWIANKLKEEKESNVHVEFKTTIESAIIIPCSRTIERDFSLAYSEEVK